MQLAGKQAATISFLPPSDRLFSHPGLTKETFLVRTVVGGGGLKHLQAVICSNMGTMARLGVVRAGDEWGSLALRDLEQTLCVPPSTSRLGL